MRPRGRPWLGAEHVEVVLLEADAPDDPDPAVPDQADDVADGRDGARRRQRRWTVAVVVAVLAVVLTVNVADAGREAARRAGLAQVPGILFSLDQPPEEVWAIPGASVVAEGTDVLVVQDYDGVHNGLRAVRPADGEVVWTRELAQPGSSGEYCGPLVQSVWTPAQNMSIPSQQTHVMCIRTRTPFRDEPGDLGTSTLTVIDAATGLDAQVLEMDGAMLATTWLDEDMVAATVDQAGAVHAVRWEPLAARVVWRFDSAPGALEVNPMLWRWQLGTGTMTLGTDPGITVNLDTGQESSASVGTGPGFGDGLTLQDGTQIAWTADPTTGAYSTTVAGTDGRPRFTRAGSPWWPTVWDRSDPVLLNDNLSGLVLAVDAMTGDTVWEREYISSFQPLVRVDGVIVAVSSSIAIALDEHDGSTLWTATMSRSTPEFQVQFAGPTDGDVVLLPDIGDDVAALVALDLATGNELWRTDLPKDTYSVSAVAGTLVLQTAESLIGMR